MIDLPILMFIHDEICVLQILDSLTTSVACSPTVQ
jgi:hypothetical protein